MKKLTPDELHESYRIYEKQVEHDVKVGALDREAAHRLLKKAKENYKNQAYNKQMDKLSAYRDRKKSALHF